MRMRAGVGLTIGLSLAAISAAPLSGQDADVERLRAALAASPDDPRPRCELAFALVRAGQHQEAVDVATVAIDALRARSDRASVRLLGACLYNRGRGREALGQAGLAIADYADSVDLRPNDVVLARLRELVPEGPLGSPLALVAATIETFDFQAGGAVATARTRDGTRWAFVASGRTAAPSVVAVARLCGVPVAKAIDEGSFDNHGSLRVEDARPRMLGDLDAVVVTIGGAGDATCGQMDGVMDHAHEATAVVFADGCRIRSAAFVTHEDVCERRQPDGLSVRLDGAGNAIATARRGHHAPAAELGTFRLRDVAR